MRRTSFFQVARVGIDTGGTFTDFIAIYNQQIRSFKIPSTPDNPARAILTGLKRLLAELPSGFGLDIVHGTTVATNALLERKGARLALLTTAGFEDVLEIGRQARPDLYNLAVERPAPLVPAAFRLGVKERISSDGAILVSLDDKELQLLVKKVRQLKVESVAISLLFSFANPAHERALAAACASLNLPLSVSHQLLPEYREYERVSTVVSNAYLAPKVSRYLQDLQSGLQSLVGQSGHQLRIMQSSGGSISAHTAAQEPVRTILSGPAGGVVAATRVAALAGFTNFITFDMGGTSTDVALCRGSAYTTNEAKVTGLPIAVPVLDIHTVGAGGGSIATVDVGGALRVGPESAGANPGPACYGIGTQATVTDANVVLGRFGGGGLLSGAMSLDQGRAERAIDELAKQMSAASRKKVTRTDAALGVVRVANANMERALRLVSIERGQDPRDFTLVSFGGAGGLHAVALAESLRIPRVLIPAYPGAFSALGVLLADVIKDYSKTVMLTIAAQDETRAMNHLLVKQLAQMQKVAQKELRGEGIQPPEMQFQKSLSIRYQGQSFELEVQFAGNLTQAISLFHQTHLERYGHSNVSAPLEIVSARLRGIGLTQKPELKASRKQNRASKPSSEAIVRLARKAQRVAVYTRESLPVGCTFSAPALIVEYGSTTLLPPGWIARVDAWKNLLLSIA
ncbi:MAG: hydantoinase/oxoprolinase family protein [Blastocatellia bacterium]|nr:hydantoinase/oxoprolinase family protein [Blastocatellia bacterium]